MLVDLGLCTVQQLRELFDGGLRGALGFALEVLLANGLRLGNLGPFLLQGLVESLLVEPISLIVLLFDARNFSLERGDNLVVLRPKRRALLLMNLTQRLLRGVALLGVFVPELFEEVVMLFLTVTVISLRSRDKSSGAPRTSAPSLGGAFAAETPGDEARLASRPFGARGLRSYPSDPD